MAPSAQSHWGWGDEDRRLGADELAGAAAGLRDHLGFGAGEPEAPVPLEAVRLPEPRIEPPAELRAIASASAFDRARHAHGRSYVDVVRGFRGAFPHPPDAILRPRDERELEAVLEWCSAASVACVPWGGGTSVVGGVDARPGATHVGAITLHLGAFDQLLEVDAVSRAARIQAGATGPRLERQLGAHGLTLRFFPQSFELSTLGGWIATRAAGHFATGPTHIDDLVESVRAITPVGEWASRRLPASGAGPSPDRLMLGSEGTLGVICDAWVRVRPRPSVRRSAAVRFPNGFFQGADAVRAIVQDGLQPANCRLIDPEEARVTGAAGTAGEAGGRCSTALLVLGFEDGLAEAAIGHALHLCAEAGGAWDEVGAAAGAWREAFLRAPYLRDAMVAAGIVCETFETAITWERLPAFVADMLERTTDALREEYGDGLATVRLTHAYPDGAAPYFTCLAPARRGEEVEQWLRVKQIVAAAVLGSGGTITHHHAVGRDHRPWYDQQRPAPFGRALHAAKGALDPLGVLNPGVLLG